MKFNIYKFLNCLIIFGIALSPMLGQTTCDFTEPIFISIDIGYGSSNNCRFIPADNYSCSEGITSQPAGQALEICTTGGGAVVFQSEKFIDLNPGFLVTGQKGMTAQIGTCCPEAGTSCDDGDECTINDQYDANCLCTGTSIIGQTCDDGDACTINDVYTDCEVCEGTVDVVIGMSCDDGNACTINDVYTDCEVCEGTVDVVIGMTCDDGDACTINDVYTDCEVCEGILGPDTDGDGVPDPCDSCPNFDNNLIGQPCSDGVVCTIGETYDMNCNCSGGVFQDSDDDGICDAEDPCPYMESNDIQEYTDLVSSQNVTIIPEISGLTYNDVTGEFVAVSDAGQWAKRIPSGAGWNGYGFNNYGTHCVDTQFSDVEAITYMSSYSSSLHRYAIADERDRSIAFVDVANSDLNISHPTNSYLKFSGFACGGNNGIEGIAYDQGSNVMYFATEYSDQKIYSFSVPSTITGQTIAVQTLVDLSTVAGLSTYSTHGLDVMPNGNVVALVTKPGTGDNGLFERMIVEFDTCGIMLGQVDLEPTIANSAELEGITVVDNDIYVIGENAKMYQLSQVNAASIEVVSPDTQGPYGSGTSLIVNWTSTNVSGQVKIELYKSGNFVSTFSSSTTNDGSHFLTLPFTSSNESGYTINITSIDDPSVTDSSVEFTINAPTNFTTVTSNSRGESYVANKASAAINTTSVYPNPFFDNIKIELELIDDGPLHIDIFDLQGKIVKNVINNDDTKKGHRVFVIDGNDIESGLYFINVRAGKFTQTTKVTKL